MADNKTMAWVSLIVGIILIIIGYYLRATSQIWMWILIIVGILLGLYGLWGAFKK